MNNDTRSAAEWQELLTEKDCEIAELRKQVGWLTQQFKLMQSRQFASSSEKTTAITEQVSLFNESEVLADPEEPEPEIERISYARKKRKGKREADFSGLPTEQIIHELPEQERACPDCGNAMHACGHDVMRRELTCVPAQYKVTEHVQTVYSCRHCERTSDHVPMKKSTVPAAMLPGSGIQPQPASADFKQQIYACPAALPSRAGAKAFRYKYFPPKHG